MLICIAHIENRYKNGSVEVRKQISSEFRVIRYDAMVTKWSSRSKWMSILCFCLTSRTPIKIPSQMMQNISFYQFQRSVIRRLSILESLPCISWKRTGAIAFAHTTKQKTRLGTSTMLPQPSNLGIELRELPTITSSMLRKISPAHVIKEFLTAGALRTTSYWIFTGGKRSPPLQLPRRSRRDGEPNISTPVLTFS